MYGLSLIRQAISLKPVVTVNYKMKSSATVPSLEVIKEWVKEI